MFNVDFSKFYFSIISYRNKTPATETVEVHHILPLSMGGTNDPSNLVSLTAREHFICHCLLLRMTTGKDRAKMIFAAHNMMYWKSSDNDREFKISSRMYHLLKSHISKLRRRPLTPEERAKYTPERMKNTWAHIWRTYKITFPDGTEEHVNDLTKWCKETGNSLTTLRKSLKSGEVIMSNYAKGKRGSGCKPSKLDGVKIEYA
jgi:hypothetical protein